MWSTFYYSNCVRGADLLAFQQEFWADFKSHAGVKRMKRSAGVVLQKQPTARSAFVNTIIIWKRCQMLAFMPTETSSWEKRSLKAAITLAAFKPSILDLKNHFISFYFPLHTKPNYFLAVIRWFHLSICWKMSSPPSIHSSHHTPNQYFNFHPNLFLQYLPRLPARISPSNIQFLPSKILSLQSLNPSSCFQ